MTFLLGLVVGLAFGGSGGVILAALFASTQRREAAEIHQLRPKPGRDKGGRPVA